MKCHCKFGMTADWIREIVVDAIGGVDVIVIVACTNVYIEKCSNSHPNFN